MEVILAEAGRGRGGDDVTAGQTGSSYFSGPAGPTADQSPPRTAADDMNAFLLLCVAGAALARPSRLDGLEHSHDAHHHHEAHAIPEAQFRSVELPIEEPYQEPVGPPQPYQFTYQAGRYPNHVDRTHSESRGTDGVVVGTYEYLDPLRRVVKVDYTADEDGFHPNVQGPVPQAPRESAAVAAAREKFFTRSAQIVAEQARIGQEHARLRAAAEAERAQREAESAGRQQYQ